MPVEGQWERVATPLGTRDKRFLVVLSVVATMAVVAGAIVYAVRPAASHASCVVVDFPSTMGGATARVCGPEARTFCLKHGAVDRVVAAACREKGYAIRSHA